MPTLPYIALRIDGRDGYFELWVDEEPDWPPVDGGNHDYIGRIRLAAQCLSIVDGKIEFSDTGMNKFIDSLRNSMASFSGQALFRALDPPFELAANFKKNGHVILTGRFKEHPENASNYIDFEILTDQTYIDAAICEMDNQ